MVSCGLLQFELVFASCVWSRSQNHWLVLWLCLATVGAGILNCAFMCPSCGAIIVSILNKFRNIFIYHLMMLEMQTHEAEKITGVYIYVSFGTFNLTLYQLEGKKFKNACLLLIFETQRIRRLQNLENKVTDISTNFGNQNYIKYL